MRVLHVYRTYFPDTQGGLEEAIRQICLATKRYGVHNHIFTVSSAPQPRRMRVPEGTILRFRKSLEIASCGFATPAGVQAFRRLAQTHDLIHYHFPWPFGDLLHVALRINKPAVVTYQSDVVRQKLLGRLYYPLMHRFLDSVDRIIATSPNYVHSSQILAPRKPQITVIPNTIDPASYPQATPADIAVYQQRFGKFFLFVGVLRYYKGLDYLLEAATQVSHSIVIAGDGPEGAHLRRLAKRLGNSNVHFLGRVPDTDKVALMNTAHAVVFPSHLRAEAFGMTLLEGAMFGKPLISCDIGTGTCFINRHGQTGLVVPPRQPSALASAINLLASNDNLAMHMGREAKQHFENDFSSSIIGRRYMQLYQDVLLQHAAQRKASNFTPAGTSTPRSP